LDFLKNRQFIVKLGKTESSLRSLDRGCVQGSVLGPALFSLYCRNLKNHLRNSTTTSYADDSYIITSSHSIKALIEATSNTMIDHFQFLESLGMVVNKSKTELMIMETGKKSKEIPKQLKILDQNIDVSTCMKILGITFDNKLKWTNHMDSLVKKANRMISGLKIIRKKLSEEQFLQVATSQYIGTLYYGISVWYDTLLKKDKRKLEVLHYRVLRTAVLDWHRLFPRNMLDTLGRAKPLAFSKYSLGSIIINAYTTRMPVRQMNMF